MSLYKRYGSKRPDDAQAAIWRVSCVYDTEAGLGLLKQGIKIDADQSMNAASYLPFILVGPVQQFLEYELQREDDPEPSVGRHLCCCAPLRDLAADSETPRAFVVQRERTHLAGSI